METRNYLEQNQKKVLGASTQDALNICPEAATILRRNKKLFTKQIKERWDAHRKILLGLQKQGYSQQELDMVLQLRLLLDKELVEIDKNLRYVNQELAAILLRLDPNKGQNRKDFCLLVETAKAASIVRVCEQLGITLKREMALCPLHPDKTPSFKVYPQNNRYYCFGCQSSGDSIQLVMNLKHLRFKEAILFINSLLC